MDLEIGRIMKFIEPPKDSVLRLAYSSEQLKDWKSLMDMGELVFVSPEDVLRPTYYLVKANKHIKLMLVRLAGNKVEAHEVWDFGSTVLDYPGDFGHDE